MGAKAAGPAAGGAEERTHDRLDLNCGLPHRDFPDKFKLVTTSKSGSVLKRHWQLRLIIICCEKSY
jgi:hypothetical protein